DHPKSGSEIKFQPKLDLASGRSPTRQFPKRRIRSIAGAAGRADTRQRWAVCRWEKERRGIAEVEKFAPELQLEPFGEVKVFENGDVRVLRSRTSGYAAGGVAKLLDGGAGNARGRAGNAERGGIEVSVGAPVATHHGRTRYAVRDVKGVENGRKNVGANVGRKTATECEDAVHFPSTDYLCKRAAG